MQSGAVLSKSYILHILKDLKLKCDYIFTLYSADTASPKSYTTTVNIETRGKQSNKAAGHPVNKEIILKVPYAGDLPEAKEHVTG